MSFTISFSLPAKESKILYKYFCQIDQEKQMKNLSLHIQKTDRKYYDGLTCILVFR